MFLFMLFLVNAFHFFLWKVFCDIFRGIFHNTCRIPFLIYSKAAENKITPYVKLNILENIYLKAS